MHECVRHAPISVVQIEIISVMHLDLEMDFTASHIRLTSFTQRPKQVTEKMMNCHDVNTAGSNGMTTHDGRSDSR